MVVVYAPPNTIEATVSATVERDQIVEQGNLTTGAYALLRHTSQLLEIFLKKT